LIRIGVGNEIVIEIYCFKLIIRPFHAKARRGTGFVIESFIIQAEMFLQNVVSIYLPNNHTNTNTLTKEGRKTNQLGNNPKLLIITIVIADR
jgi:hypothetical protein